MTKSAIQKMVEWLEEYRNDSAGDYAMAYSYALDEARRLAQEEKSHKAEAPASLVERLRQSIEGHKKIFEAQQEELDSRVAAVKNIEDIVSEYRPTPQADILGELKSVLYAPCVFSESWKKVEKAKEIISKFEGGVK